jgi:hypothetical protein
VAEARRRDPRQDRELPIWDIAVATEGRASLNVKTYGEQINDPLLAEAIDDERV